MPPPRFRCRSLPPRGVEQPGKHRRCPLVKRRFLELGAVALVLGVLVLLYHGPGRTVVRGHVGDVAATMLVYALLGLAWNARLSLRASATMGIAIAIELGQTMWKIESATGSLLLGTTWDAWDIVAYAIGTAIAIGWERVSVAAASHPDPASSAW